MPATSEAPESRGVLGIPKSIGEEFAMDSAGQAASLMLVAPDGMSWCSGARRLTPAGTAIGAGPVATKAAQPVSEEQPIEHERHHVGKNERGEMVLKNFIKFRIRSVRRIQRHCG